MGNFVEEETLLLMFLQKFSFRYFIYNRCSCEFTHTQYYLKLPNGTVTGSTQQMQICIKINLSLRGISLGKDELVRFSSSFIY